MCTTCGCDHPDNSTRFTIPGQEQNHAHKHGQSDNKDHEHEHTHNHAHPHDHEHTHSHSKVVTLEQDVLAHNNLLAERNRGYFEAKNILALNMVSSPGSGKTTILEKTITDLKNEVSFFVVEGDQQTLNDANRINATGAPVIQINTGSGCHLDSDMINKAVKKLEVKDNSVLIIENVGNLVCPAMFDLGEAFRVVVISVTEGEDKPLKYPAMFNSSNICLINKIDLLPYVDFSVEKAKEYALQVNHHLQFFEISSKTGEGMKEWYEWLKTRIK
ncbi:MAG: hydrogenase nickel incorporation protein HypB [Bacteroidetes bacterium]|nr:hydrogenase nickel incorporation protein HypB [Bacteroidota bacterium]